MYTNIAVILVGIWLILVSRTALSDVITLIFGIVVTVLAVVDFFLSRRVV